MSMPGALFVYLVVALAATGGYVAGSLVQRRKWEALWIRAVLAGSREAEQRATSYACALAAHTVGVWPHQVNHRAELVCTIEALATAPNLDRSQLPPHLVS